MRGPETVAPWSFSRTEGTATLMAHSLCNNQGIECHLQAAVTSPRGGPGARPGVHVRQPCFLEHIKHYPVLITDQSTTQIGRASCRARV